MVSALCGCARFAIAVPLLLVGLLPARAGATPYDMIVLDPNGGQAYGIDHGRVVGGSSVADGYWSNNGATFTTLAAPAGFQGAIPTAIGGNEAVGRGVDPNHQSRAILWIGTGAAVNLTSGPVAVQIGYATATDGVQQVGVVSGTFGGFAALWSGTPDSFVNLNPNGYSQSSATGVYGGIQVGYGTQLGGGTNALVWHGGADTVKVLSVGAEAMGISRGQVVGLTGNARPPSLRDAAIWNLSGPSTLIDVAPANTTASELLATNGTQQVGDVSLTQASEGLLPPDHHAGVWTGSSITFQTLPVPQGDNYSMAYGIDGEGNIAGVAGTESNGNPGGLVPILWVAPRFPGDANFDGRVNFSDLTILAKDYGKPGEWVDGDFNRDGKVGFDDLVILAANYGKSQSAKDVYSVQVQVPEPSSAILLGFGALVLRRRRC